MAERVLRRIRPVLLILSRVVVTDDPHAHRRIDRSIKAITADLERLPGDVPLRGVIDRITQRLQIARTLAVPANLSLGADSAGRSLPFWLQLMRPLRANLNWKSPALRHALRSAATAAPALAFTMFWFTPYDHWLTITIVATMQPFYSLTYTKAIERIVGTALGGAIAALVGLLCTTPVTIGAAMCVLAILAFAIRAVSFGLFMMALTPLVVLLVETGTPGTHEWTIAAARAALTTIGGLIAVAANFMLWPSREPDLVSVEVKNAIAQHGAYAEATLSALLSETTQAALGRARRAAGVASNALEALITRALLDPGQQHEPLEAAMVIDAALRRCAGRLATLEYAPFAAANIKRKTFQSWRAWIGVSLRELASGQTKLAPRPGGAEADAFARIARQIELMAGAMERLR
jgi:uncharacterized membrane protein YccC